VTDSDAALDLSLKYNHDIKTFYKSNKWRDWYPFSWKSAGMFQIQKVYHTYNLELFN